MCNTDNTDVSEYRECERNSDSNGGPTIGIPPFDPDGKLRPDPDDIPDGIVRERGKHVPDTLFNDDCCSHQWVPARWVEHGDAVVLARVWCPDCGEFKDVEADEAGGQHE